MGRWPVIGPVVPPVLSPWFNRQLGPLGTTVNASTTFTANSVRYYPVIVPQDCVVTKLWLQNGAAVSGNVDVGIYDEEGNRLVSAGSTAQAGTNAVQVFDVTDTRIPAGLCYFAFVIDNTTGAIWHTGNNFLGAFVGHSGYLQAATFPLPAVATFAGIALPAGVGIVKFGALVFPRTVL